MKNNFNKRLTLIFSLVVAVFLAQCSFTKNSHSDDGYKTIFFDDFDSKILNPSVWNVEITGRNVNHELQAYVDSEKTIYIAHGEEAEGAVNGALVLQPRLAPGFKTTDGKKFDFISGRINTRNKFEFKYGTAEARIKLTEGSGLWPAWWLLGKGNWPDIGEVDIMEYVGEKNWASAAVHGPGYSGETPFVEKKYFSKDNDVTKWHIYAVDWTPDSLVFKYDNSVMYVVNKKMVEKYGKWSFDNDKFLILNYAIGGAYPIKLNHVRQPYYGITLAAVDSIKDNKAKMLIDWVRVKKRIE